MSTSAVKEYMDYATMHGIGRLKNSPFYILKIFWVLSLMGSLGMIIYQFLLLWDKYQSNPISTHVELKTPGAVDFPVVTICNTNPVRYYGFSADTPLQAVVNEASVKYSLDYRIYDPEYTGTPTYSKEPIDNDVLWSTSELFRMTLSLYSYGDLQSMSQTKDNFVLLCNYNGIECTNESIVPFRTFKYGLCYNIYPELQHNKSDRVVTAAGRRHGLELLLNIDQANGVPFVTQSAGVYVMVHGQNANLTTTALHGGMIVPNGVEGDIEVSITEHVRVQGNSGSPRCSTGETTYENCIYNCELAQVLQQCHCNHDIHHSSYIPMNLSLFENDSLSYQPCKTEKDYDCIQQTLSALAEGVPTDSDCYECRVPCNEVRYERDLSIASWPSKNFEHVLKRILSAVYPNEDLDTKIKEDLVMIRVFFETLSYPSIKEEYSYSTVNFISDLGGTLGLWAGFSVLSLLELFELIVLLLAYRKKQKNAVTDFNGDSNGTTRSEK